MTNHVQIRVNDEAEQLAKDIRSGVLKDEDTRSITLGPLFDLYVPADRHSTRTNDVIRLIKGLRLSDLFDETYTIELDSRKDQYGEDLSDGEFANLFESILKEARSHNA